MSESNYTPSKMLTEYQLNVSIFLLSVQMLTVKCKKSDHSGCACLHSVEIFAHYAVFTEPVNVRLALDVKEKKCAGTKVQYSTSASGAHWA